MITCLLYQTFGYRRSYNPHKLLSESHLVINSIFQFRALLHKHQEAKNSHQQGSSYAAIHY